MTMFVLPVQRCALWLLIRHVRLEAYFLLNTYLLNTKLNTKEFSTLYYISELYQIDYENNIVLLLPNFYRLKLYTSQLTFGQKSVSKITNNEV